MENRVLPPIETTSLVTKLSILNGVQEPDGSIKSVDNELTSNTSVSQQQHYYHHTDSFSMGNNVMDFRAKSGNESYANTCIVYSKR